MSIVVSARAALGPSCNAAAPCLPSASSPTTPLLQHVSRTGRPHFAPCNRSAQTSRWPSCAVDSAGDPARDSLAETSSREGGGLRVTHRLLASQEDVLGPVLTPGTDPNSIREWELDFCSRPIFDARGKRIWELVVCDSKRRLQFAKFYPNNVINSVTLKEALVYIMQTLGLRKPHKIRFFRSQMQIIVSKACAELDIQPVPSRRCFSLIRWLNERYESVYSQHPGFREGAAPLLHLEQSLPLELPDTLRGEQWAFVQLPLPGVLEEVAAVERGSTFGSPLSLDVLGLDLPHNAVIPGVAVASSRATPLAAWTNALELASLEVDRRKACVVLSTGVSDRWLYAFYRKKRKAEQEAEAWEATKRACGGLHFLAVQQALDSDLCTGFWLLLDRPLSRV